MIEAADAFPMNLAFAGKGNASRPRALVEQIEGGASCLKLHEDWGTTPAAIDCALAVADDHDVQVMIHTDTLNESGFVEDTIAAFKGRTIHAFHTEGAGGIIAAAPMGDPNASIPTPQPVHYRPMFGAFGRAIAASAATFVSQAAIDGYLAQRLGVAKKLLPVRNTRGGISKKSMLLNDATPSIEWTPRPTRSAPTASCSTCEPAKVLPMAQRYFLY